MAKRARAADRIEDTPAGRPRGWVCCGLAYAACVALMVPPAGAWPLAIVAVLPLALAGRSASRRPVMAGLWVAAGSSPAFFLHHWWLIEVSPIGYPLLAVYNAAWAGLFVTLLALCRTRLRINAVSALAPGLWVALEVLRGEWALTGYPWFSAAHPLIEVPVLASAGAIVGVYGVSALIAWLCGAAADATSARRSTRRLGSVSAICAAGVWAVLSAAGWWSVDPGAGGTIRVAVVQTNVPQDNRLFWTLGQKRADFREFMELTRRAATIGDPPDLILWPETMFPGMALNPEPLDEARRLGLVYSDAAGRPTQVRIGSFADVLVGVQSEFGIPMIVGARGIDGLRYEPAGDGRVAIAGEPSEFNSAFLVAGGRVAGRYDKVWLTPFGEMLPLVSAWPALASWIEQVAARGMQFALSSGDEPAPVVMSSGGGERGSPGALRVATPICFEIVKTRPPRRLVYDKVGRRASLIANLTNDGWFHVWDAGREQHLQIARWRCVELGVPMARAANTGVSALVSARGRVTALVEGDRGRVAREPGVVRGSLGLPAGGGTVYGRYGAGIEAAYLALPIVVAFGGLLWQRRDGGRRPGDLYKGSIRPAPAAPASEKGDQT